MGIQSNFKIAVNELLSGVISNDEKQEDFQIVPEKEPERQQANQKNVNTSLIAEDVVIEGSVTGNSSIQIEGTVKGNVNINGDIFIKGNIEGDIKGKSVSINNCNINGNITAESNISIDNNSVIEGNINADSVYLNGRINGDVDANEKIILKKSAVVFGNIRSCNISIEEGASLKGQLEVLPDKNSESIFDLKESGIKKEHKLKLHVQEC